MAQNGPVLWENDATGSRKVFKWLRGFWEAIPKSKIAAQVRKCKSQEKINKQKSQNGAGLVGKLSGHLGGVFLDFGGHFQILYGLPEVQEVSKNLPGAPGVVFPKYGPIPSHGGPIHSQNDYFLTFSASPTHA